MDTQGPKPKRIIRTLLISMVVLNFALLTWIGWPWFKTGRFNWQSPLQPAATQTSLPASATLTPIPTNTFIPTQPLDLSASAGLQKSGVIILAMMDGNYSHLFAYHPQFLPMTRLTGSPWNDITPSISADGQRMAFASQKNGYWDIYAADLNTGIVTRLTDTPEYDAAPTWSSDSQWIAFESYVDQNFEIYIRSLADAKQAPIRLTDDPSADFSPAWSPKGREIAFVSSRSGDQDIWLASLDQIDNRFTNISHSASTSDAHPAWSPDGRYLTWTATHNGINTIMLWDSQTPQGSPRELGVGNWAIWSPAADAMATISVGPNQTSLGAFRLTDGSQLFPAQTLWGDVNGFTWSTSSAADLIQRIAKPENANAPRPQLWQASLSANPMPPSGRFGLSKVADLSAPYPYLHDAVDESFVALRQQVAQEVGWDALASLENAYVALTEPPTPSMEENWLYTGRAIAINTLPLDAGWMQLAREDYAGQTYWRIYLKARYQDGSQGVPLHRPMWNMSARTSGSARDFEAGGDWAAAPAGFWIDFTEIAGRFSWQRLPALSNWRAFYPAARINQFVLSEGLDWLTAMQEVYPPEALSTRTPTITATPTITETPEDYKPVTSTPTATITPTPTLHFTWTPAAGAVSP